MARLSWLFKSESWSLPLGGTETCSIPQKPRGMSCFIRGICLRIGEQKKLPEASSLNTKLLTLDSQIWEGDINSEIWIFLVFGIVSNQLIKPADLQEFGHKSCLHVPSGCSISYIPNYFHWVYGFHTCTLDYLGSSIYSISLRNKVEMKYKNGCYPIYPSTKLGALGVCQSRRMQMISWHSVCFDTLKIQFTCVWNEV